MATREILKILTKNVPPKPNRRAFTFENRVYWPLNPTKAETKKKKQ